MKDFIRIIIFGFMVYGIYTFHKDILEFYQEHCSSTTFEDGDKSEKPHTHSTEIPFTPLKTFEEEPQSFIEYVHQSDHVPIEEAMVMKDETDFNEFKKMYSGILAHTFTLNQTRTIQEIIISESTSFGDGECGLCETETTNGKPKSFILIASRYEDHVRSLLHECCHALYYDRLSLFNSKYRERWNNLDGFVTQYAATSIEEDFAETGSYYLSNGYAPKCKEKLKLFEEFYNETK